MNIENSVMLVLIEISHAVKLTYFSIKLQYVKRTAQNCVLVTQIILNKKTKQCLLFPFSVQG